MSKIVSLAKEFGKTVNRNSPAILSGLAVAGVVTTGYLSCTASFKAAKMIAQSEAVRDMEGLDPEEEPLTLKNKIKLVWPAYIPAAAMGALTIAAIVTSQSISARRQAAVVSLYTITDKAYAEYRDKVIEKIGEKQELSIRDDISKDRLIKDDVVNKEVIITGNGDQLCYDELSGRVFMSNADKLLKAQNDLNNAIIRNEYASQNDWYGLIGLDPLVYGDELGWNHGNMIEIHFSSHLLPDNRPCLSVKYKTEPLHNYYRPF